MKTKTFAKLSLYILFFFLFLTYAAGQSARGKGRISGEVIDEEGNPIVSAKIIVEFLGGEVAKREVTSNKRGAWGLMGLGTGRWKVTVTADGYVPASTDIYVQQLERNPKITLTLNRLHAEDRPLIEDESSFELLDQGNQLFSEKKYDEALLAFEEFLEKNPKAYQVRLNIADCFREKGEYEKAIEQCNLILEKISEGEPMGKEIGAKAQAGIGECYLKKNDLENAQKYFKLSVETYQENEIIAYNIGEIYFSNQKLDEAVQYFTMATQIKPDWSDAFYKLGLVYLNKPDYEMAKDCFEKFLALEPETERSESVRNILSQLEKIKK